MLHDNPIPTFRCQCGAALEWRDEGRYFRAECLPCNQLLTILKQRERFIDITEHDEFGIDPTPEDEREWSHLL